MKKILLSLVLGLLTLSLVSAYENALVPYSKSEAYIPAFSEADIGQGRPAECLLDEDLIRARGDSNGRVREHREQTRAHGVSAGHDGDARRRAARLGIGVPEAHALVGHAVQLGRILMTLVMR